VAYKGIPFEAMSTSDVVDSFVRPVADSQSLSVHSAEGEIRPEEKGEPTVFVSHAWASAFVDVVRALERRFSGSVAEETFVWMDIFGEALSEERERVSDVLFKE